MKILVIGSGGREHALCRKIKESPRAEKIYAMPGNAGTSACAENVDIDILDNDAVKDFCVEKKIDLVVVGPEQPLARGITDFLENAEIKVCGPSYAASRMESSGQPGRIQLSEQAAALLEDDFVIEERGKVEVKGKGCMTTYWLLGHRQTEEPALSLTVKAGK